jgi:hypothetical protein
MKNKEWVINTGIKKFVIIAPTKRLALLNFRYENIKEFVLADKIKISRKTKKN